MNIINKILITTSVFLLFLLAGGPGSEVKKSEESLYEMLQGNWVIYGDSISEHTYVVVSNDTLIEKDISAKRVKNEVYKFFFSDVRDIEPDEVESIIKKVSEPNYNKNYYASNFAFIFLVDDLGAIQKDELVNSSPGYAVGKIVRLIDGKEFTISYFRPVANKPHDFIEVEEIDEEGIMKALVKRAHDKNVKGEAAYREKKYEQARSHFIRAIVADDENARGYLNLSLIYIQSGSYGYARENAEKGIKYSNNDNERGMGYYNIGLSYEKGGDKAQALANYKKSYSLRKNKQVLEKIKTLEGK